MKQTIIDVTVPGYAPLASLRYPQDFADVPCATTLQTAIAYTTGVMASVKASVHPGLIVAERAS